MARCSAGPQNFLQGHRGLHVEREVAVLAPPLVAMRGTSLWTGLRDPLYRSGLEVAGRASSRVRHRPEGFVATHSRSAATVVLYTSGLHMSRIRFHTR